jgi:hypothetical protein
VRFGPIAETEPAAWRQVIDINLTGTYLGMRDWRANTKPLTRLRNQHS